MIELLLSRNGQQHLPALFAPQVQPEVDHILPQFKIAVKCFAPYGCFLTDLRNSDLLKGFALHETEQSIRDHMLTLDCRLVCLFVIHKKTHFLSQCVSCSRAIETQILLMV